MSVTTTAPRPRRHAAGSGGSGGSGGNTLTGTGTLIRFILRRDRVRLPIWVLAITGLVAGSLPVLPDQYPTQQALDARADLLNNPATIAITGPAFGTEQYTYGAMVANELLLYTIIAVALMSVMLMVRHTRAEEETERTELLRAGVLGRHAGITAAFVVIGAANLLVAALLAVTMPAALDDLPTSSSLLFGAAVAAVGLVFTGVAAVAAQVTEHARAASGMAAAVLGVAFALRAIGDIGNGVLSWLSPIGWAQRTRVYVDDRWWPLLLAAGLAVVLVTAAFVLNSRRDVGAGLVRPRPGPARGSGLLSSPLGLAIRMQRSGVIGWAIGLFIFGLAFGGLASDIEDFVSENSAVVDFLDAGDGGNFVDAFMAIIILMMALLVSGFAISAMGRLRAEETTGRAEPVLATAVDRVRYAGSHLVVTLAGCVLLMLAATLGVGITAAIALDDPGYLGHLLVAGLAHTAGLWLVVGIATALFGWFPQGMPLAWIVLTYGVVVGLLGGLFQFPDWLIESSPFDAAGGLPGGELRTTAFVIMGVLAVALVTIGLLGFRRRDLTTT